MPSPKSTANLKLGDYCAVKRSDGRFVPLVFVGPYYSKRSTFVGALLGHVASEAMLPSTGDIFHVSSVAILHISYFAKTDASILGNIAHRLVPAEIDEALKNMETTIKVWGHETPKKYADQLQP